MTEPGSFVAKSAINSVLAEGATVIGTGMIIASNNQDKGPTRRMTVRMDLMFPRRSP